MNSRIREQLLTGSVWLDRDCVENHDGLIHAIRCGDPREFAEDVYACLTDESPLVRKGALATVQEVAEQIGAERLAALPPAPELCEAIARVVRPGDITAIAYLRRSRCVLAIAALARVDSEWLVANARGLVAHNHLAVFPHLNKSQRLALIAALAPYPPMDLDRPYAWRMLPESEQDELRRAIRANI